MSYQVLARKWRPKQFTEMVGQEHVLKALVNALDDNRLHHAYLFTGTRGVGKTSIARLFAKALNCEQGVSSKPCGQCSACEEIAQGRFVDLIEVDAASRTKVEDTRELLENVQYAPTRGRFKVYLIDEVHMLSKSSFNALLKTLEEPPPHVKFLLATTDPQKLPVTVLSRCLQFNLKNMIPQRIVEHLTTVLSAEQITFDEAALWLIARSADGSMRDALSLTDQSIAFGAGSVTEPDVRVMLGTIDLRLVSQMLSALVSGNGVAVLKCVENLAQFSPDYNTILGDIISLLHRIAIAQAVPSALDNSLGDKQQVTELAAQLTAEDVQLYYQIALMGRKDLPYAPDAREALEMTLMRMLAFRPAQSTHIQPVSPLAAELVADSPPPVLEQPNVISSLSVDKAPVPLEAHLPLVDKVLPNDAQSAENTAVVAQVEKVDSVDLVPGILPQVVASAENSLAEPAEKTEFGVAPEVAEPVSDELVAQYEVESNIAHDKSQVEHYQEAPIVASERLPEPALKQQPVSVALSPRDDRNIAPWEDSVVADAIMPAKASASDASYKQPQQVQTTSTIDITKMLDAPVKELSHMGLDNWPALVGAIGFTGMTAHIAENLSLESIEGEHFQFNVSQVQKNVLDDTQKERIQHSLGSYFKRQMRVTFDSLKSTRETPWQCFEKLRATRLRQAISSFQADEVVVQLVSVFNAEIDRSSIMPVD